jgi:hypothetical protein
MYDTLNFWLSRVEAGGGFENSAMYLTNAKETVDKDTGDIWTVGSLNNLRVTVSMAGVSIKGSLAKFYFPDNTYTLNRHQVKEAIGKLSDALHLDLLKAGVTRLDVSTNFIMKHEISCYFDVLGLCTRFKRIQTADTTLSYCSAGSEQTKAMIFYDKARETASRNCDMPDVYKGANLLRYESRWNTRLPQQLKEPEVKGCTLYDRRFYGKIISLWADNYFRIDKKRTVKLNEMENIKTVSDAMDYICAIGLQRLTPDELQTIMGELKRCKVFSDRNNYTRLKKMLKDSTGKETISETNDLVKELNSEVRQILAYKR